MPTPTEPQALTQPTLEWSADIHGPMDLPTAKLLEKDGWRLPTRAELVALYDSQGFPDDMREKWFWSSTPYAPYPAFAWIVYFDDGFTLAYDTTNAGHVRLVRSGQPFPLPGRAP